MKNMEAKRATEDTEASGQGLHPKLALSNLLSSVEPSSGRTVVKTVSQYTGSVCGKATESVYGTRRDMVMSHSSD